MKKKVVKICKECGNKFTPLRLTTEPVCQEYDCRVAYALKIAEKTKERNRKRAESENRKYKQEMNISLMSSDKYRAKVLQPVINEIARLIDYNQPCIATGNFQGKMSGGHFISVGSNRTVCLNLHNIFIQSFESNSWKGGDNLKYRWGIKNTFGTEYLDFMEGLQRCPKISLSKDDMIDIYKKACEIRNKLKKSPKVYNKNQRIELRNQVNLELGIYQEEYCVFNF